MYQVPARAAGLIASPCARLATCYKITRVDGTVYRLTGHDRDITLDGEVYTPMDTVEVSAIRRETALKAQNADSKGIISSTLIKSDDLRAGKYKKAKIEETLVDWKFPFAGKIIKNVFWVMNVSYDGEAWSADLESLPHFLGAKVGDIYTRDCGYNLGDSDCGVNLVALQTTGTVVGMLDGDSRRIIRAASIAPQTDGYYDWGEVVFTSGANNGEKGEVKTYVAATLDITLQLQLPYKVLPGDAFTLKPGCNKLKSTCKTKYSNVLNFGGYPYIPTTDRVLRITPR